MHKLSQFFSMLPHLITRFFFKFLNQIILDETLQERMVFMKWLAKELTVFQKGIWPELGYFKVGGYMSESGIYQDCRFDFVRTVFRYL
jgi:hypothetical protein